MPVARLLLFPLSIALADGAISPFVLRPISPAGSDQYHETMLPADIDKDGDMDFFSGQGQMSPSWWFERRPEGWKRRLVNDTNHADVGGFVMDVDADGWPDKVSSGLWYRNPGFPAGGLSAGAPDPAFEYCYYTDQTFIHDIYPADFDGDGRQDALSIDFGGIRWYRAPPPDSACGQWAVRMINGPMGAVQLHGGIAAGDLDGDGDQDVAWMDRWYENADGKGATWVEHANIPLGPVRQGNWGLSGRALIVDVDLDGHNDLLESECDIPNARVFWFANPGGKGQGWVRHVVKDSTDGQDFHSMLFLDFDGDGDRDIFSGGGGASDSLPKAYIWENLDSLGGSWKEHVLLESELQFHDAAGVDMDGDGDLDILAKDWNRGSQFYLENQAVPGPGAGLRRVTPGGRATIRKSPAWKAAYRDGALWRGLDGRLIPPAPSRP